MYGKKNLKEIKMPERKKFAENPRKRDFWRIKRILNLKNLINLLKNLGTGSFIKNLKTGNLMKA